MPHERIKDLSRSMTALSYQIQQTRATLKALQHTYDQLWKEKLRLELSITPVKIITRYKPQPSVQSLDDFLESLAHLPLETILDILVEQGIITEEEQQTMLQSS